MKTLSLLGVFVLAKALTLAGRPLSFSPWLPVAYLWQDVAFVLLFAVVEWATRRQPWLGWGLYGAVVVYVAVNVPIACLLATPLTWPLLRAARGALADSIVYHLTWVNVLRVAVVLAAAGGLPLVVRRLTAMLSVRTLAAAVALGIGIVIIGPTATARLDTLGLHRNVFAVLVTTALPRVAAEDFPGEWRLSPFGSRAGEDLSHLRGAAKGCNVVVVHLESTGARYLRPYGAAEDPMPQVTALARRGLLFEHAYTTYPETIKSFFAVQCALFPALDTRPEAYAPAHSPALAQVLAGAGYRTALFHSGRFRYLGMDAVLRNRGYQTCADAGDIGGDRESSFGIDEPSTVRQMLRWVDALPRGRRFLLTYLPIAGHHPYLAPPGGPFAEDEEIGRYRNALHDADAALGRLLRGLRRRGLERKTLVVVIGDHGEAFGQHPGNYGHTLFVYEENVRVPLLIAAPGRIPGPVRVRQVASLVDTAPTILDLLGLPIPRAYQGRSLLEGRSHLALFCTDYSLGLLGLRDGRWKLIHDLDSGRSRLFDLVADPDERRDLSGSYPDRVSAYREHLLRWGAAQKYRILHPSVGP
jgi:hypothetical protein